MKKFTRLCSKVNDVLHGIEFDWWMWLTDGRLLPDSITICSGRHSSTLQHNLKKRRIINYKRNVLDQSIAALITIIIPTPIPLITSFSSVIQCQFQLWFSIKLHQIIISSSQGINEDNEDVCLSVLCSHRMNISSAPNKQRLMRLIRAANSASFAAVGIVNGTRSVIDRRGCIASCPFWCSLKTFNNGRIVMFVPTIHHQDWYFTSVGHIALVHCWLAFLSIPQRGASAKPWIMNSTSRAQNEFYYFSYCFWPLIEIWFWHRSNRSNFRRVESFSERL